MPPISCSVSSSPVRVGFISTFSIMMSEPGTISAATSGKPAEDGSPGTAMIWPVSLPWPSMRMWRTPSLVGLDRRDWRRTPSASFRCGRASSPAR